MRAVNKAALITGASRGIGRGIALALAKLGGFDLAINYASNEAAAQETAAACEAARKGVKARIVRGDVSSAEDRAGLVEFMRRDLGRLDLLVNNAGVAPNVRADILDAEEESFDRLISINLKGPYFLTQLAARYMIEQLSGKQCEPGAMNVVTISSISAYTASVNRGDYCISKAGLSMHTQLWAARLAEHGIGVFEVQPGIIETDMTSKVKERYDKLFAEGLTPLPRWGTPEDVGQALTAIAMGHFPYSTGMVIDVDGGFRLRRL
jgi:3-oxoacyl-[acyl-carrier protein] reductase